MVLVKSRARVDESLARNILNLASSRASPLRLVVIVGAAHAQVLANNLAERGARVRLRDDIFDESTRDHFRNVFEFIRMQREFAQSRDIDVLGSKILKQAELLEKGEAGDLSDEARFSRIQSFYQDFREWQSKHARRILNKLHKPRK